MIVSLTKIGISILIKRRYIISLFICRRQCCGSMRCYDENANILKPTAFDISDANLSTDAVTLVTWYSFIVHGYVLIIRHFEHPLYLTFFLWTRQFDFLRTEVLLIVAGKQRFNFHLQLCYLIACI